MTATVIRADAQRLGNARAAATLVFADAPYGKGLVGPALDRAAAKGWIEKGATIVIETEADEEIALPAQFDIDEERVYGNTKLTICRYESPPAE